MASSPCGKQFKSAFSCFHYSMEEIKGSDCVDRFRVMQECMQKYPDVYPQESSAPVQTYWILLNRLSRIPVYDIFHSCSDNSYEPNLDVTTV
ncbi:hypothetical protein H8958_021228 [Nasalis larvatus]